MAMQQNTMQPGKKQRVNLLSASYMPNLFTILSCLIFLKIFQGKNY